MEPTVSPTMSPTMNPTVSPTTMRPTMEPTMNPTMEPTEPTRSPTISPPKTPTMSPTMAPTVSPTMSPTVSPTKAPTPSPTIALPDIGCNVPTNVMIPEPKGTVRYELTELDASDKTIDFKFCASNKLNVTWTLKNETDTKDGQFYGDECYNISKVPGVYEYELIMNVETLNGPANVTIDVVCHTSSAVLALSLVPWCSTMFFFVFVSFGV